jgi:release factor glutamine methyltransferase
LLENDIKNYEPIIALDGGEIGFLYYTNILNKADLFLKPDGVLIMEIDDYIYDYILEYINTTKWIVNNIIYDYNKIKRVIVLRRK